MRLAREAMLLSPLLVVQAASTTKLPSALFGHWRVGSSYYTPGPAGTDTRQAEFIGKLRLVYTSTRLRACGETISVRSIETQTLDEDSFVQTYGFRPKLIEMVPPVIDVSLNGYRGITACGRIDNLGAHLLLDHAGRAVMEVANAFFPLKKG
jgi:hypothetical protein